MKTWQAASLVEHPGHSDQSVHGRRVNTITVSKKNVGGKTRHTVAVARGDFYSKKGERVYRKVTPSSMRRLGRALAGKVKGGKMGVSSWRGRSGKDTLFTR